MPSCCPQCCRSAHSAPHASPLLPTGQYYGLPSLSIRAAAYHLMAENATGFQGTCPASWVHLLLGHLCGPDVSHMVRRDGTAGRTGTAIAAARSPVHKPTPSGAVLGSWPPPTVASGRRAAHIPFRDHESQAKESDLYYYGA